jgi:putative acetyltransferase
MVELQMQTKILVNKRELVSEFIRLNEEWISHYFEIEDVDCALAENPWRIIENGGYIFSLVSEGKVLGVCALFNEGEDNFELARMAVSPDAQGNGYGNLLVQASLSKLAEIGARRVYLISNTKLAAAIALYQKHGFTTIFEGPHPAYARANIVMERGIV